MSALDRRYVAPTWGHSSSYPGLRKRERFALVDRILNEGAKVFVLATNDITVHAWAAGDGEALHFVYVPPGLRGNGLARRAITALLGSYPERIHTTHIWPRPSSRFVYAPHLLNVRSAA